MRKNIGLRRVVFMMQSHLKTIKLCIGTQWIHIRSRRKSNRDTDDTPNSQQKYINIYT